MSRRRFRRYYPVMKLASFVYGGFAALTLASQGAEFKLGAHNFTLPEGFSVQKVAGPGLVDRPIVAEKQAERRSATWPFDVGIFEHRPRSESFAAWAGSSLSRGLENLRQSDDCHQP